MHSHDGMKVVQRKILYVLILVLMEDALALRLEARKNNRLKVLILVLMEDALAHIKRNYPEITKEYVLILVLMEDALALGNEIYTVQQLSGLNPCSNGRCTRTL